MGGSLTRLPLPREPWKLNRASAAARVAPASVNADSQRKSGEPPAMGVVRGRCDSLFPGDIIPAMTAA